MELLIPGLILVALMVYASTRIKRTAAAAFEAETIETDEFIIQKPDGFLNVINGDPKYSFEAYSKEFGGTGAEDFRQGRANLTVSNAETIDEAVSRIKDSGDEIVEDMTEVVGTKRYRVIETTRVEKAVKFRVYYKIAEKGSKICVFEGVRLADASDEFGRKIEAFVHSFELK